MPKVSEEYKEKKRQELLQSAMECFGEKGYHESTIDDIVAHSGMSKGAVYNYFKTKEEIYLTLLDRGIEKSYSDLTNSLSKENSATAKLRKVIESFKNIDYYNNEKKMNWGSVQLEFWVNASRYDELRVLLRQYDERFVQLVVDVVNEGKQRGEFKEELDANAVSEICWFFLDGGLLHSLLGKQNFPYMEVHNAFESMLIHYVKTQ